MCVLWERFPVRRDVYVRHIRHIHGSHLLHVAIVAIFSRPLKAARMQQGLPLDELLSHANTTMLIYWRVTRWLMMVDG